MPLYIIERTFADQLDLTNEDVELIDDVNAAPVGETVTGECTPLHRGRTTTVWQTRITSADKRLVAVVTQTQLVIEATRT